MTGSLAYRKNETAILSGDVPEKYLRLLPYITGERILEIGSAEGVLALLLAKEGKDVAALERSSERHEAALNLRDEWARHDVRLKAVRFFRGDIADNLYLFNQTDTLVAVRMVYYLGDSLNTVFDAAAKAIPNVVLCGNKNRADRYHAGTPDEPLGLMNYYAGAHGMAALLERHGYTVVETILEGDPIVVGRMD